MLVKEYLKDSKTKCLLIRGYKLFVSEEGQFKLETKAELKYRDYIDYDWTEEEKEKYLKKLKEDVEETMNAVVTRADIFPRNQEIVLIVEKQPQQPTMEKKFFVEKHEGCETRERKEAVKRAVKEAKEEALAKAEELVFPKLEGTEKQVSWAESIRKSFFVWCESVRISPDIMINGETGAKFWIDHKDELFPGSVERYKENLKEKAAYQNFIDMGAITPCRVKHDGVVEILEVEQEKQEKIILLLYKKDTVFADLMKSYGYWRYGWQNEWIKKLTAEKTFEDTAAEIGHALLEAGYCIYIHDKNVAERVANKSANHKV